MADISKEEFLRVGGLVLRGQRPKLHPGRTTSGPARQSNAGPREQQSEFTGEKSVARALGWIAMMIGLAAAAIYFLGPDQGASPSPTAAAAAGFGSETRVPELAGGTSAQAAVPTALPLPPVVPLALEAAPPPSSLTQPNQAVGISESPTLQPPRPRGPRSGSYAGSVGAVREAHYLPRQPVQVDARSVELPPPWQDLRFTITQDSRASFDARIESRTSGELTNPAASLKGAIAGQLEAGPSILPAAGVRIVRSAADGFVFAVLIRHRSWPESVAVPELLFFEPRTQSLRKVKLAIQPTRVTSRWSITSFTHEGHLVYRVTSEPSEATLRDDFYSEQQRMAGGLLCSIDQIERRPAQGTCGRLGFDFPFEPKRQF